MSLLLEAMEDCTFMDKTKQSDGYGGTIDVYKPGISFKAAFDLNTSMEARIGAKQGVTNLYTITTPKSMTLEFNDVLVRDRDGKAFRVKSDGSDKRTPGSASLDMRQVTAESFIIPPQPEGTNNG